MLSQVWTGFFEYWMEERDENGKYKAKMVEKFKHGKRHHGLDRVFIKDYTYDTLSKLTVCVKPDSYKIKVQF